MDRRQFFRTMIGGIAATTAVRTWPFRVFSFPSVIAIPEVLPINQLLTIDMITKESLRMLENSLVFTKMVKRDFEREFRNQTKTGTILNIRKLPRCSAYALGKNDFEIDLGIARQMGWTVDA